MKIEGVARPDQKEVGMVEAMSKRIEESVMRMVLEAPNREDIASTATYITERFRQRGQALFPERAQEFEALIERLKTFPYSSVEALPKEITKQINVFLVDKISPEDLETKLRENLVEQSDWASVNEALSYHIEEKDIGIHIPMMFTKKPMEMLQLFEEGLHMLAAKIKNDPLFAGVERVTGQSWIIYEHPYIMKKMGFEVSEVDEKEKKAFASISRENFLKRYGS
ncbi:MAG: hypothetical protein WCK46_02030 [Candidatus Adlerbacteria bacterium]